MHQSSFRQFVFTVNSSMGLVDYIVVSTDSETANQEVGRYFSHDPNFKINKVQKLNSYRINRNPQ